MSKVYIFSGLGVDRRVFKNIDFGELDIEHVEWIKTIIGDAGNYKLDE